MKRNHRLYLAGPLCFYPDGNTMWNANRKEAEFNGFEVTMPNDNKLVQEGEKISKAELGRRIFKNTIWGMERTDGIIANLETYRGSEPDGGTVYEMGMAYARGAKIYAFTRDKRTVGVKYQAARYNSDAKTAADTDGVLLGHPELPFSVCVTASAKIIEGDFSDCLKAYITDLEEESKKKAVRGYKETRDPNTVTVKSSKPLVYVATADRDDPSSKEKHEQMARVLRDRGFEAVFPADKTDGIEEIDTDDAYTKAYSIFDRYMQHVRNCDIILCDLNDFRGGYEPNTDVAFETGYAFMLGKKMFGYMDDVRPMTERIPNTPTETDTRDLNGMNVENFDAPLNLMFGSSMPIYYGFDEAAEGISSHIFKDC